MKKKLLLIKNIVREKGVVSLLLVFFRVLEKFFRAYFLFQKTAKKKINERYLIQLDLKGPGFDQELFLFRNREELETDVVKGTVKQGMRVLDLGANIGYYTLLLSNLVGESGRVFAVEPLPANFEKLKVNLLLNNVKNVEASNVAVSDRTGELNFFVGKEHNLGSLVEIATEKQTGNKIRVKAISLADYLNDKPNIDLIRMDIERGELPVFRNIIEEFPKKNLPYPKRIMFEVHPQGRTDPDPCFTPLLNKLLELGYRAEYAVASSNSLALQKYRSLGYTPQKISFRGQALFSGIKKEHLVEIAARRPKITRALLLTRHGRS